ncbi:MAG: NAD(P)-dependent oxidoreductase [Geminicoccaceae bacterium]|jgi:3-hydroxyisobutyrate dehydrogenase-like beta-hydroxyacid dehydrogenase|nr:NAD(P)-dependent oxidoreductase [Geminicoccaceae bacterium]
MSKEAVGYIGLGHMGSGMVRNLLANGWPVVVHDQRTQAVQAMVKEGATAAGSAREVAESCRVVLSSLPDPAAVDAAALGEGGIIEGIQKGGVYIDLSSIDPNTSRKVHAALAEKGARMLDCPVGKGPPEAASGDLALMIGGDADLIEEMRPLLETLGSSIHHCGPAGAGAAAKLINNLVSCSLAALSSEAVVLGAKAGVDLDTLCTIMASTAADNRHLRITVMPRTLDGIFEPRFKLALAHKDLGLACRMGLELGVPTPLGSAARIVHDMAMGMGLAEEDQGACIKPLEKAAGVEARRRK